jgi:hypothetical protein
VIQLHTSGNLVLSSDSDHEVVAQLPTGVRNSGPDNHAPKGVVFRRGWRRVSDTVDGRELLLLQLLRDQMDETMQCRAWHDVDEQTTEVSKSGVNHGEGVLT